MRWTPKRYPTQRQLGDYAFFYRAESEAGTEAKSGARRDYNTVYGKYPDSMKVHEARIRAAETAVALGDPMGAIKDVGDMAAANDADALFVTAQAHEAMGKNDQAIELYRRIYYQLPATSASIKADQKLAGLDSSPKNKPGSFAEERARADGLFESKQYTEAGQAYDQLIARFPEADRIDEIHLRRGISLLNSKQPSQAASELARVSERSPDLRGEALFNQAEALRRASRSAESSVVVDRLLNQYPKSKWSADALYSLATYLNKQERESEASARYRQLLASFPKSQYASEASYNLGWFAYKAKSYNDSARLLQQHLATYRYPETEVHRRSLFSGRQNPKKG
jgi:TolA-binding protein